MLRGKGSELMLRRGEPTSQFNGRAYEWDVYLRCSYTCFRGFYQSCVERHPIARQLERMPYGLAEFEIVDPDGYVLCLSQSLDDADDLPTPGA